MWESSETVQLSKELAQDTLSVSGSIWRFIKSTIEKTIDALQHARPASILLVAFAIFTLFLIIQLFGPGLIQSFSPSGSPNSVFHNPQPRDLEIRQFVYLDALMMLTKYSALALAAWALMRLLTDALQGKQAND